jgi:RES domain
VNPGTLPAPPADLPDRALAVLDFQKSIFRSHGLHRHPVFFGKSRLYRFDAPDGSYGVLYAGTDLSCAFIESLIKNPRCRVVTTTALKTKAVAELHPERALRLIDLTSSESLMRIGADSRLFSADHAAARRWSKALHDHPILADGILYPSRLDPVRQSVALFSDRAPALVELSRQTWYAPGAQRRLLAQIADHYKLEIIENHFIARRKPVAMDIKPARLFEPPDG